MTTLAYDPEAIGLDVVRSMGEEVLVMCPYHSDRNASAEYNLPLGLFYCFTCQTARNAKQLAEDLGGYLSPVGEVLEIYSAFRGQEEAWLNLTRNPLARDNEYLMDRLVTNRQVETHGLLASPDGIIFPIKNKFQKVTGVQIRHYDKKPKYKIFGQKQAVWPSRMFAYPGDLFITEGVFGALRAESAGVPAAAIMGASGVKLAAKHLKAWEGGRTRPYVVMDRDYAGMLAAGKFVLHEVPAILAPWKTPPDEWICEQWEVIAKSPEEFATDFVMDVIEAAPESNRLEKTLRSYYRRM